MGRVILDAELRKKLNDGRAAVEVCDEAGNVLGEYVPAEEMKRRLIYAEVKAAVSKEEIAEARREMLADGYKGATTEDVKEAIADARRKWEQLKGGQRIG